MTLNRLVARANPYSDHTVSEVPTDGAEADLLQEIVTTTATETVTPARGRTFLHRGVMTVASAAAVAAVIALGGSLLPQGDGTATVPPVEQPGPTSSTRTTASYKYASSVIAVAKANQRLLLDVPGWRIKSVIDFGVDSGEMTFGRPGDARQPVEPAIKTYPAGEPTTGPVSSGQSSDLYLMWYPAKEYKSYYDDRANGNPAKPIELLGQKGTMFQYKGSTDFTTILPVRGSNFVEIRANVGSERAYRELVGKLHQVDVQTWLDAMPASVVRPEQAPKVVDEILADLPLPKGFDKRPLYDRNVTTDRYQVGVRVTGAVTCAWIGKWLKAKDNGDAGSAKEAADALKTSRSWKILREMEKDGAWSQTVWELSDKVVRGEWSNDKGGSIEYKQMLGCK